MLKMAVVIVFRLEDNVLLSDGVAKYYDKVPN